MKETNCTHAHCRCMNLDKQCPHLHYADCLAKMKEGMTTPHIQSNEEEHWKYILNKLLKAVSRDDTGSFKDVEDWHSQQIATAVEKERERIKVAFLENFKGAGELWFPYNSAYDTGKPMSEKELLEAPNEQWENIMEALTLPTKDHLK